MADKRFPALRPFFNIPSFWEDDEWQQFFPRTHQSLEVYETDDEVVVKAPVPGIPADKVDITFEDGILRVSARMEETEEERKKKKVVHSEYRESSFNYAVRLPRMVDATKMNADVEHGIVTITAPLAEAARPRRIAVNAKGK
jgi:HSP20 family protein